MRLDVRTAFLLFRLIAMLLAFALAGTDAGLALADDGGGY